MPKTNRLLVPRSSLSFPFYPLAAPAGFRCIAGVHPCAYSEVIKWEAP